jgi:hypothetical protein
MQEQKKFELKLSELKPFVTYEGSDGNYYVAVSDASFVVNFHTGRAVFETKMHFRPVVK